MSARVVNLCVCVVQSCGDVVRIAMVVSGLNQCKVIRFCKRVSTVVLEWKERVSSWVGG